MIFLFSVNFYFSQLYLGSKLFHLKFIDFETAFVELKIKLREKYPYLIKGTLFLVTPCMYLESPI